MRRCMAAVMLAVGVLVGGCLPSRVVIDLDGDDGRLGEKRVLADAGAGPSAAKVALIDVEGLLSHAPQPGLLASRTNAVDELARRLTMAEEDPRVRAVVLRVNSPGGTVAASETMHDEIASFRARSGKPVVVSMAEVAASGGYYISLAGDRLLAQPSSVTGSIGVIVQTINVSRGLGMIGIEARAVKSGEYKDIANPLEPAREEHYRLLQGTVDDYYASFRALVEEKRPGIPGDRLNEATDGRIFTGRQALEAGLVDGLGGLREAFDEAKRLARLERAQMVKYHSRGRAPGSAYSAALGGAGEAGPAPLVRLTVGSDLLPRPGFYYLWTMPERWP